ncbi:MAG TPA: MFS transporter [Solirubrobacterales bacterium]|nr:MFS transporter [Solirubrobacterales bacterium]
MLSAPQVGSLATASIVGRLPFGMCGVAFVIFVHARTGSFGVAGLVTGLYTLAFALAGPLLGRQVDRRGPRPVLGPASVVCALALLAVVAIGDGSAATVPLALAALVAGAAMPPISGVVRRTWPALIPRHDLTHAYLFDSILIETVFVCGPLLTGLLTATVSPAAPLLVAAGLVILGTSWFLLVPVVGVVEPAAPEHHTRAGALAAPAIRFIVLTGLPIGASFGALDVALPAFGVAHGSSALGGLFAAAVSLGSMLGAVLFGLVGGRFGNLRQASFRLAVLQPLVIAPVLLAPSPLALVFLAVLAGTFVAPAVTLRSRVAELTMPPGTGTETFTWLLLSVMVGTSASAALAGPLVEAGGWRLGVLLAIAVPLAALPAIFAGRRLLPTARVQHG